MDDLEKDVKDIANTLDSINVLTKTDIEQKAFSVVIDRFDKVQKAEDRLDFLWSKIVAAIEDNKITPTEMISLFRSYKNDQNESQMSLLNLFKPVDNVNDSPGSDSGTKLYDAIPTKDIVNFAKVMDFFKKLSESEKE